MARTSLKGFHLLPTRFWQQPWFFGFWFLGVVYLCSIMIFEINKNILWNFGEDFSERISKYCELGFDKSHGFSFLASLGIAFMCCRYVNGIRTVKLRQMYRRGESCKVQQSDKRVQKVFFSELQNDCYRVVDKRKFSKDLWIIQVLIMKWVWALRSVLGFIIDSICALYC